jgi:hypothetical protein
METVMLSGKNMECDQLVSTGVEVTHLVLLLVHLSFLEIVFILLFFIVDLIAFRRVLAQMMALHHCPTVVVVHVLLGFSPLLLEHHLDVLVRLVAIVTSIKVFSLVAVLVKPATLRVPFGSSTLQ